MYMTQKIRVEMLYCIRLSPFIHKECPKCISKPFRCDDKYNIKRRRVGVIFRGRKTPVNPGKLQLSRRLSRPRTSIFKTNTPPVPQKIHIIKIPRDVVKNQLGRRERRRKSGFSATGEKSPGVN